MENRERRLKLLKELRAIDLGLKKTARAVGIQPVYLARLLRHGVPSFYKARDIAYVIKTRYKMGCPVDIFL